MKFTYVYRTSDNVIHDGVIVASSREDVYQRLKPQGIKPYNVKLAPGLLNRIASVGKRWLAIAALALGIVYLLVSNAIQDRQGANAATQVGSSSVVLLPRQQIAGLPEDWRNQLPRIFPSATDQFFAIFAQPGDLGKGKTALSSDVVVGIFGDALKEMVEIKAEDAPWVGELKRIVVGMKSEALAMRNAGKTDAEISIWLTERQRMEADYRARIITQIRSGSIAKDEAKKMLAAMGLEGVE